MDSLIEKLTLWDNRLFIYLNQLGSSEWDSFWYIISQRFIWIPFYALLTVLVYKKLKNWRFFLVFILLTTILIIIVDQSIASFFKPNIHRFRPCHFFDEELVRTVNNRCGARFGFFSAHSANAFALATIISKVFNKNKFVGLSLFIWASFIAYSRIYLGVHFPLDVLAGALYGILWGSILFSCFEPLKKWLAQKTP